jgi:xanthine dehydrogenase molybdopterin-binding subunit B
MVPTRRGSEQLHWLVLAALPLHAFLSGLGSAAAQDVAQGLKRLVGRVVGAHRKTAPSAQVLVLQDAATRLQVVLEADLPAEAYEALVALDLSVFRQGPVHYDRQRGRWRSELDEWQQRQG